MHCVVAILTLKCTPYAARLCVEFTKNSLPEGFPFSSLQAHFFYPPLTCALPLPLPLGLGLGPGLRLRLRLCLPLRLRLRLRLPLHLRLRLRLRLRLPLRLRLHLRLPLRLRLRLPLRLPLPLIVAPTHSYPISYHSSHINYITGRCKMPALL